MNKTKLMPARARAAVSSPIAVAIGDGPNPSTEVLEDVPSRGGASPSYEHEPFGATVVKFPEGSQWVIADPMSQISLQQAYSPCEARQVFTAVCMEDPTNRHSRGEEAVMKIKFQVQASVDTMQYYQDYIRDRKQELSRQSEKAESIQGQIIRARELFGMCRHPTTRPNSDTVKEVMALQKLAESRCSSAPWLLSFAETTVQRGIHVYEVEGGYLVFTLMTKLPGSQLSYEQLSGMNLEERNEVRVGFKEAFNDVCGCGVIPNDPCLSNVLWDREEKRCYIVDFEHCELTDSANGDPLTFRDAEYKYWGLDKKLYND